MINPFRREDPALEEAIAEVYRDLQGWTAETEEYQKAVDQLVKLNALKNKGVDPDKLLVVVGNFVLGMAVLKHERLNVITTKMWSFLPKI